MKSKEICSLHCVLSLILMWLHNKLATRMAVHLPPTYSTYNVLVSLQFSLGSGRKCSRTSCCSFILHSS